MGAVMACDASYCSYWQFSSQLLTGPAKVSVVVSEAHIPSLDAQGPVAGFDSTLLAGWC